MDFITVFHGKRYWGVHVWVPCSQMNAQVGMWSHGSWSCDEGLKPAILSSSSLLLHAFWLGRNGSKTRHTIHSVNEIKIMKLDRNIREDRLFRTVWSVCVIKEFMAICSVSLSSRLVLFEYWCYDNGEHSFEILSVSWVQIRCVCEVLLASIIYHGGMNVW